MVLPKNEMKMWNLTSFPNFFRPLLLFWVEIRHLWILSCRELRWSWATTEVDLAHPPARHAVVSCWKFTVIYFLSICFLCVNDSWKLTKFSFDLLCGKYKISLTFESILYPKWGISRIPLIQETSCITPNLWILAEHLYQCWLVW